MTSFISLSLGVLPATLARCAGCAHAFLFPFLFHIHTMCAYEIMFSINRAYSRSFLYRPLSRSLSIAIRNAYK